MRDLQSLLLSHLFGLPHRPSLGIWNLRWGGTPPAVSLNTAQRNYQQMPKGSGGSWSKVSLREVHQHLWEIKTIITEMYK